MNYLRHTLCYLNKSASPLSPATPQDNKLLSFWLTHAYPLIVPRQQKEDKQIVHLAIPYCEQHLKRRARYIFCAADIVRYEELPKLAEVFPNLYQGDEQIAVYGSYCWHYLTQQPYIRTDSDVDLLVHYESQTINQLTNLYDELTEKFHPTPIDGEVRFPKLGECSWQELIQKKPNSSVLIKSQHEATLLAREELYALFPTLLP